MKLGERFGVVRVLVRGLAILATLLHAAPAVAQTPTQAPQPSQEEADKQLRDEVNAVVKNPPTGSKEEVCPKLNELNGRIVNRPGKIPPMLQAPHSSLQLVRCPAGCCSKCQPGQPCIRKTTCDGLVRRFSEQLRDYEACQNKCSDAQTLTDDIEITFIDLVKECPRGDADVAWARSKMSVIVAPSEIVARTLQLIVTRQVDAQSALDLLDKILALDSPSVRATALQELTKMAKALAARGDKVSDDTLRKLFAAASELLSGQLSRQGMADATRVLKELKSDEHVKRMLNLLVLARDLEDPSKLQDLQAAVELLFKRYPDLRNQIPPPEKMSFELRLQRLVSLLNNAKLAEFDKLREDITVYRVVEAQRRLRLKIAVSLEACNGSEDSSGCVASKALRDEFVKTLKGKWLQGADEIGVDTSLKATLEDAAKVLDPSKKACAALETDDGKKETYAGLCGDPFLGVVGLQVGSPQGNPSMLEPNVYWIWRTVNKTVEKCWTRSGSCPRAKVKPESSLAAATGVDLAVRTLEVAGISKWASVYWKDPSRQPPAQSDFERFWQKFGRPVALLGGIGLAVSGVYVSNKNPESSAGDWLWRSGLAVFAIEIGVETWLYFEN